MRGRPMSLVFIGSAEDGFVDAGRSYDVGGLSKIRFGRALDGSRICFEGETGGARVGIPHPWVSGEHCQVELDLETTTSGMALRDLQSRNGTLLENKPVLGTAGLRLEEVFEVGRTFWMLRSGDPESDGLSDPGADQSAYAPLFSTLRSTLVGVAASQVPVLVLGETGTGKEHLARAIHQHSGRTGAFVPMRLGAYADDELAAALVGSRRSSVPSFVDRADKGTLFLTDIGGISAKTQTRLRSLLSRIMEGRGRRRRDIRLVSASVADLRTLVEQRKFRPELYSRLAGVELALPPLRQRRDRIGALIRSFAASRTSGPMTLSTRAFRHALAHQWPFNVRELHHALGAALSVSSDHGRVNLAVFEEVLREAQGPATPGSNYSS